MDVIFQPIEFNTLITKIDDTYDYDCILIGNYSDTGTDPYGSMNILKSSGYDSRLVSAGESPFHSLGGTD